MRIRKRRPVDRAYNQASIAVRRLPTCRSPVGLGAYRPADIATTVQSAAMGSLDGLVALVTGGNGGIGLGMAEPDTPEYADYFRIGHMGHQNIAMVMALLGSIDTAMKAQGIAHGTGALEAAAGVLAGNNGLQVAGDAQDKGGCCC